MSTPFHFGVEKPTPRTRWIGTPRLGWEDISRAHREMLPSTWRLRRHENLRGRMGWWRRLPGGNGWTAQGLTAAQIKPRKRRAP
jgi:hypothetical protein